MALHKLSSIAPIFGIQSDGALTISADTNDVPLDATCTGSAGATTLSATNASFQAGMAVLIWQTQGTNAGNHERNYILSYTTGVINLALPLKYTYTSGAQVVVLKQYTDWKLDATKTLSGKAWGSGVGGVVAIIASSSITVNGTINASGNNAFGGSGGVGRGFKGGDCDITGQTAYQGESQTGSGVQATSANGAGGGGGFENAGSGASGGGGGYVSSGGSGTANGAGSGGVGGSAIGISDLSTLFLGAGGGGAAAVTGSNGGGGGAGGGVVILIAPRITITGSINTNGGNAGTQSGWGGGGGAGGSVLLVGTQITLGSNTVTALGGAGGTNGGNGANGRIAVGKCKIVDSGTTNPSYSDLGYQTFCGLVGRG